MQVKIVIGTISFMLTMIILGFAALGEPSRLQEFTDARLGRQIEGGAELYQSQCATCHGVNGKAEECYNSAGEQIGCAGLPLNYNQLLCGDRSARMEILNWGGSKDALIRATIASGRYGTAMPTWSQEYGGPLRPDEIEDITYFVLNWETEALCAQPAYVYEWPETIEELLVSFPDGDAARGAELYVSPYGCSGCHGNLEDPASAAVGPWQGDLAQNAGTRVEGLSGAQYVYESILHPNNYIVPDCPNGPCTEPSAMPGNFGDRMGDSPERPQDLVDIMTYLGVLPLP